MGWLRVWTYIAVITAPQISIAALFWHLFSSSKVYLLPVIKASLPYLMTGLLYVLLH